MNIRPLLLLPLVGLLLSSCASFERDWKKSVADYQSGKVSAPSGPWVGTWTTTTNGHTGDLRAIVKPSESRPGEYDFRYHATWAKYFSGVYTVSYPVKARRGSYSVDGQEKLGLFGTFGHKATISGNSFQATYSNEKGDVGSFSLKRPQ